MPNWSKIEQDISSSLDQSFQLKQHQSVAGGDTNQAYFIDGHFVDENTPVSFFVKFNQKNRLDMFEAEAEGLQEIENSQAIRVPHVVCTGLETQQSFLVLEKLPLAMGTQSSAKYLGEQLARMHKQVSPHFGWSRDNTIGSTQQINTQTNNWIEFWREQRLGYQLQLAKQNGASQSLINKGEELLNNLEALFIDYEPKASLLHGDMWSGNYGYLKDGTPVIFDPAVYYGDREADIAMTELFGGFSADFYSSYNEVWPLDKGYQQRKVLYNLYHVLNHYNLFGGGYGMQAENNIDQLLACSVKV